MDDRPPELLERAVIGAWGAVNLAYFFRRPLGLGFKVGPFSGAVVVMGLNALCAYAAVWAAHRAQRAFADDDEEEVPEGPLAAGNRVVVLGGDHDGRHGTVVRSSCDDLRRYDGLHPELDADKGRKLRDRIILLVEDLLKGRIAVRLDGKQDLHTFAAEALEREPNLANLARPMSRAEVAKYGGAPLAGAKLELMRTFELLQQMKQLDLVAPVDFSPAVKAYLKRGRPARLMPHAASMLPAMVRMGMMPRTDSRGMPRFQGLDEGWSMDAPPWTSPHEGGSGQGFAEYNRAEKDFDRRASDKKLRKKLTGVDVASFLEYHLHPGNAGLNMAPLDLSLLNAFYYASTAHGFVSDGTTVLSQI